MKIQTVILVSLAFIIKGILHSSDAARGAEDEGGGGRGPGGASAESSSSGGSSSSSDGTRGLARMSVRLSAKSSSMASKAASNFQAHAQSKNSLTYSYGTGYSYYRQSPSYHYWGVRPIYIGRYRSSSHEKNRANSITTSTARPGKQRKQQTFENLACFECVHHPRSYINTPCLTDATHGLVVGCRYVDNYCIVARFRYENDSYDEGIYRGCILETLIGDEHLKKGVIQIPVLNAIVSSFTLCGDNFCNFGDGRLKCSECQGKSTNDSCMEESKGTTSNITTCNANEFCFIQRTMMPLNETVSAINSTADNKEKIAFEVNITRGCQPYPTDDDDFQVNDGEDMIAGVASLVCASDLCNSIDADYLTMTLHEMVRKRGESGSSHSGTTILFWWINFCLIALVA